MKHFAAPSFWACHRQLPASIREVADKNFALLKNDPHHPSLHFKKVGRYWAVRAGIHYRALGIDVPGGVLWFWLGSHADYDNLVG